MRITRIFGRVPSLAAGLTTTVLFSGFPLIAYAWLGGLALMVWSLALLRSRSASPWTVFVAGALAGLVSYWRPEMTVLVASALPLVWRNGRAVKFIFGVLVGVLPMALHLRRAANAVYDEVVIGRVAVNAQSSLDRVAWDAWLLLVLSGAGVLLMIVQVLRSGDHRAVSGACLVLSLLVLPQGLQRIDLYHATFVACFIVPIGVAILLKDGPIRDRLGVRPGVARRAFLYARVFGIVMILAQMAAFFAVTSSVVSNGSRYLFVTEPDKSRIDP